MKLSMSLIAMYLSGRYTVDSEIADDDLTIRGIRYLSTANQELSMEYAYVGHMGSFHSDAILTYDKVFQNSVQNVPMMLK